MDIDIALIGEARRFVAEQVGLNLWYIIDTVDNCKLAVEVFTEQDANRIERALNFAALIGKGV